MKNMPPTPNIPGYRVRITTFRSIQNHPELLETAPLPRPAFAHAIPLPGNTTVFR